MRRHPRLQQVLAMLLRLWDAFELPPNPLDHLTELLGGPDKVRGDPALFPCSLMSLTCTALTRRKEIVPPFHTSTCH